MAWINFCLAPQVALLTQIAYLVRHKKIPLGWYYGSPGRIRTYDLSVNSRVLHRWATEDYIFTTKSGLRTLFYHFDILLSTHFCKFFYLLLFFSNILHYILRTLLALIKTLSIRKRFFITIIRCLLLYHIFYLIYFRWVRKLYNQHNTFYFFCQNSLFQIFHLQSDM